MSAYILKCLLGKTLESSSPAWTETVNQEVSVKGEGFVDPHPRHHGERCTVHETEHLVREGVDDVPG